MKKILAILILFLFSVNSSNSQSFQRMAIAKGTYKLSARGSSKVTAYCLDYSRKAPTGGMNYGNILSGGSQAVVEIASAGNVSRMTLDDAISKGYVGIEGANVFEGKGKELLQEIVDEAKLRGESASEFEVMLKEWDNLLISEQRQLENQMALAMGVSGGNHRALRFINKTSNEIEIKLENNLQLGSSTERNALKGIDDIEISSDELEQEIFQPKVWAARETENLENLKKIGIYEGNTKVTENDFDKVKNIYKGLQKKHNIRDSGEDFGVFDETMEGWAKHQQRKLESELEEIGIAGDFDDAIKSYQKYKGAKQTGNFSKSLRQSLRADIDKGIYISKSGDVYNTKTLKTPNGGQERVFIMKPNLYVKFTNKNSIDLIKTKLNSRKYLQEEVEVISLVRDDATNSVLKQNFPNNHLAFDMPSMRGLIQKLKANNKKSVVVVGHIEGKDFVTPLANGNEFRVSLEDLKRLGNDLDVNIFPMGCNSGFQVTGLGNKFNSVDALNRLKHAVDNNTTVMGMLEDLAGSDLKVIIDDIPFKDRGYLQAKIQRERTEAGVAVIVGGGVAGVIIYSLSGDDEEGENN